MSHNTTEINEKKKIEEVLKRKKFYFRKISTIFIPAKFIYIKIFVNETHCCCCCC